MRRSILILLILVAGAACNKSEKPSSEVQTAPQGSASGTMEVISVEPVKLIPLTEVNLLQGGDFTSWKFGTPKPAGFTLPNEQFSSITREGIADNTVVAARQTWQQADVPGNYADQFRAELPGTEAGGSYRLEIDAGGMAHIGLWEAAETGTPQPLDLDFIITQPSQDSAKRYVRVFTPRVGGTVLIASHSQVQPASGHEVSWAGWRVTKAITAEPQPTPPPTPPGGDPAPGTEQTFAGIGFVWCPPGSAMMGTADASRVAAKLGGREEWYGDETPAHLVTFEKGFWISKTEITCTQWEDLMKTGEAVDDAKATIPKTGVSWEDCGKLVEALNASGQGTFALPTESQWEYACRAGSSEFFFFGDDPAPLADYAWLRSNVPDGALQPVGQKKTNAWGVCDMLGNAWEWCADLYGSYSQDAPRPIPILHTIRGGSVTSTESLTRCAYRAGMLVSAASPRVGVRLVREP